MPKNITNEILYPCLFPIKAIGENTADFEPHVVALIRQHVPDLGDEKISRRLSADGKYLSVTATFMASSRAQLDALYSALSGDDQVMMIL
jgi:putative lipoic acid-binding regulatory protein